jgi:drug/metabolite transporter (DMT)-like permease
MAVRGYLSILGATLFWGVSATVAKLLFTQNVDTLVLVQTRISLSCVILFLYFLLFRRDLLRIKLKDLYRFALLGLIGIAGSNYTYYFTIRETNVATAILLQYLAPVFVFLYAAFSREEELNTSKIVAGAVSLAGCFLAIAGKDLSILRISNIGLASGFASACCWGFTNIWLRHILKDYKVWTALIYAFLSATVFWLVVNPPWNLVAAHYSGETWGTFLLFALISVLIPHSLYFSGMRYVTASRGIITATFEPIVAIGSAYIILGEALSPVQLFGAALVIAAIALLQLKQDAAQILTPADAPTTP